MVPKFFLLILISCSTWWAESGAEDSHVIRFGPNGHLLQARYDLPAAAKNQEARVLHAAVGQLFNSEAPEDNGFYFGFNGPLIQAENWTQADGQDLMMCLDCRIERDGCLVDTSPCKMVPKQFWFIKMDPKREKGPAAQLLFSIYSALYPDSCLTHTGYGSGTKNRNRFGLQKCSSPPSPNQTFFIDPDYFALIKNLQGLQLND